MGDLDVVLSTFCLETARDRFEAYTSGNTGKEPVTLFHGDEVVLEHDPARADFRLALDEDCPPTQRSGELPAPR